MTLSDEILLVEDDEVVAELEKRVLLEAGCTVRSVHSVKDALALLGEQSFRAIVLDYRLPDGAPWPVVDAANAQIPRTPVLLASAMDSEAIVADAFQRGVADYLKKAYGFWNELPDAVSRIARAAAIEQNLQLGDELFQVITGNLSDVILVGDMRGRARYISPACLYVLGYQPEELKEVLSIDLIHPEDQGLMTSLLANIGRHGQGTLTYRCRTKSGSYRWLESNVSLVRDPASGAQEVVAISRDVTERKHAAEEINKLKVNFELLLNGAKEYAVVMLDRQGRVTSWNSAAERIVGYAAQEVIGCHFSIFHPAAAALPQADEILAKAEQEGCFSEEGWRERKDGSLFWASVTITALYDADGELCGFSLMTHDATEAKKTAEALALARQHADEANRAKGDFLVAMSHEIRAPLNAILGLTDVLNETELNPDQREYVARCRRAGAGLLTIINDLLDLSKIESGRFELEKVPFDLEDLLETTAELIAPRAHLKGVALQARVAPEAPTHLIGDPVRLQQVLINLLGNAAKFTESGWIILSVSPDPNGPPGHLRFVVSDTGIGIPEAKLDTIFEDFSQEESSSARRFGGTGLGLGIARRLVHSFGGQLTVSSVFGEGSTFTFDAHFAVPEEPLPVALPPGAQDLAGRHVLLLDDDPANRRTMNKMCVSWGMATSAADSISEGLALLSEAKRRQQPFSLAILNALTPEEGGFAALAQIQSANPELPVIMTASQTQPGDTAKARALGAAALLLHPFRRAEMLRLLLAALRPVEAAKPEPVAPVPANPALKPNSPPTKILIAEDSDDNRFLIEVYLGELPYDLRFVENGQDAINLFEREEFDLVLMDIQMPIMDGLTATRAIRELERRTPRARTPILALTANAILGDAEESQAAGCDGHLAKPISKEELVTAIENIRFAACASA